MLAGKEMKSLFGIENNRKAHRMALLGNQATLKPGKRQETAAMTHPLRSRNQTSGNELIYALILVLL